jgi:hypothetical protein
MAEESEENLQALPAQEESFSYRGLEFEMSTALALARFRCYRSI